MLKCNCCLYSNSWPVTVTILDNVSTNPNIQNPIEKSQELLDIKILTEAVGSNSIEEIYPESLEFQMDLLGCPKI